jgi:hypothetical protein
MICMVQGSGHIGHELDVQRTRRPRDASSKNAASKRRVAQGTHCSKGRNVGGFSFGDTSVGDTLSCHPSNDRKESLCEELQHSLFTKESFKKVCLSKCCFPAKMSVFIITTVVFLTSAKHLRMNNH